MEKAIVLLSGGLDSVVLAHYVAKVKKEEVWGLFFDYDQPQVKEEKEAAYRCIQDVNGAFNIHKLPRLGDPAGYVPMRNLIFIAHAAAFAEERGIKKIYAGFINPEKEEQYPDTTEEFVRNVNNMLKPFRITFEAPFVEDTKLQVARYGRWLDAELYDVWSCNHPVEQLSHTSDRYEKVPCGKCANCKFHEELDDKLVAYPILKWYENDCYPSKEFRRLFMEMPIKEARLLINNVCNLQCKHCFYGYQTSSHTELDTEQWKSVIDECVENGIKQFHFSGKEPFIGGRMLELCKYIKSKYTDVTYDVVTNGTQISFSQDGLNTLKAYGFSRICFSFDDFEGTIRDTDIVPVKSAKVAWYAHIPTTMFIDITKNNVKNTMKNIHRIVDEAHCTDFYVRPVYCYGEAENIQDIIVSPADLYTLYREMREYKPIHPVLEHPTMTLRLKGSFIEGMLAYDTDGTLQNDIDYILTTADPFITPTFQLSLEMYCAKYENQITITADGFLLGCATEVAHADYADRSVGNILETPLKWMITAGKKDTLKLIDRDLDCATENNCQMCNGGCSHSKYCYKQGCKLS